MKMNILVIMCAFLLVLPGLSFAKKRTKPDQKTAVQNQALTNAKLKSARRLSRAKAREEAKVKKRAEKEAKKAAKARLNKGKMGPHPSASARDHANINAKFNRGEAEFNNKENKDIRAENRIEKMEAMEAKRKMKAEEERDKGEGPFKIKF